MHIPTLFLSRSRKAARRRQQTIRMLSNFERMEKNGYISIIPEKHAVLIDDNFASLFIAYDRRWQGFIANLYQWYTFRRSQQLWEERFRDAERTALREAARSRAALSRRDVSDIRQQARDGVDFTAVKLPDAEMQFMIVSQKSQKPSVAGIYDGKAIRMTEV